MKMHVSTVAGNLAHHIYTCSPWLDQRDAFQTFFLSVSVVGQMERVLKDDAIQDKGERARMVTTPSHLICLFSFLVSLGRFVRPLVRWRCCNCVQLVYTDLI